MLIALWQLSTAIRGYLRYYMPTNRAVDWLRTPRGLKWAIPVGLVATPAYLGLTALAIQGATHPGLGFFNVLVVLFFWNAAKFAWTALHALLRKLRGAIARCAFVRALPGQPIVGWRPRGAALRLSRERRGPVGRTPLITTPETQTNARLRPVPPHAGDSSAPLVEIR